MIHFEFIFLCKVWDLGQYSFFVLFCFILTCRYPTAPTPFIKKATLLPVNWFCICKKKSCTYFDLFMSSLFCSTDLFEYSIAGVSNFNEELFLWMLWPSHANYIISFISVLFPFTAFSPGFGWYFPAFIHA